MQIHPHCPQQDCSEHDEQQHNAVAQHGQRDQDGGPAAELPGLHAVGENTEPENGEQQPIENENSPAIVLFTLPP